MEENPSEFHVSASTRFQAVGASIKKYVILIMSLKSYLAQGQEWMSSV